MRTVTLGNLGAVAAVVPAGAPQYYGLGAAPMEGMDPFKTFLVGMAAGALAGALGMHMIMRR